MNINQTRTKRHEENQGSHGRDDARREKNRRERMRKTLERDARKAIQVRDHNGKLYICLDGAPLLSLDDVNGDLLDMARER